MEENSTNQFYKRVDEPTLDGGSYYIGYYYDSQDNPCVYEDAVRIEIDECTDNDEVLSHTTLFYDNEASMNAKFNRDHPVRKNQIENAKDNYKCYTTVMSIIDSIREYGEKEGWSDERIQKEIDDYQDGQSFRFYRSDKISDIRVEILENTDGVSLAEVKDMTEKIFEAEENQQRFADEFIGKIHPEIKTPNERLAKWFELKSKA